jgi:excisionase family DNA binding protein
MAADSCIAFGGMRIDRAWTVCSRLGLRPHSRPSKQMDRSNRRNGARSRMPLSRRGSKLRAHRQYDAADPENRLVASELERRWNERLASVRALGDQLAQISVQPVASLGVEDRARLLALGADLTRAWNNPGVRIETRKKIVRLLICEIIVDVAGEKLDLTIHWRGGDHTRLEVKKNKTGRNRWVTDADVADLVQVLARQMPDHAIAAVLNRSGKSTGRGNSWTRSRVCSLRSKKGIAAYRDGERSERGEATLLEAADALGVRTSTIRRMIHAGTLPANQLCKGAPWIIRHADLQNDEVRRVAMVRRARYPTSCDPLQKTLDL